MLSLRRSQCRRRDRRGTSAVEFACIAPLFVLVVFGLIEFGRAMMVAGILTNAAQQGARAGVLDGAQVSDVTATVNTYLADASITSATTTVLPSPPSSAGAGQNVTVTVRVAFSN